MPNSLARLAYRLEDFADDPRRTERAALALAVALTVAALTAFFEMPHSEPWIYRAVGACLAGAIFTAVLFAPVYGGLLLMLRVASLWLAIGAVALDAIIGLRRASGPRPTRARP